jgi:uncharacterized protein YkwD
MTRRSQGRDTLVGPACKYSCTLRALVQRSGSPPRSRSRTAASTTLAAALAACAALLGTFATPALARAPHRCTGGGTKPATSDEATVERATLCLINRIRASHRLAQLHGNPALGILATSQVTTMIELDYFADVRPTGQTPLALIASTPYARRAQVSIGQNIAWGTGSDATPGEIVEAWMASPPHRRIILTSAYRDAGVAVTPAIPSIVDGGTAPAGATYAMEFGVRRH